uniref:Uncharacterized protein n=1 Tax=Leersia perrieri TaxID=77586 RepID=A0A0D9XP64_9ORYZ
MSCVVAAAPAAAAALPALLPTPPRSKMLPLLPTPCLIILPTSFAKPKAAPKPGRADAIDRWDAHKKPAAISPPPSSSSRSSSGSPIRAAPYVRKEPGSPASSSSTTSSGGKPGRADACERWDTNKISKKQSDLTPPVDSSKRTPATASRGSSGERWDINKKKPRSDELKMVNSKQLPAFLSSPPEPSMLPMPTFLLAR